MTLLGIAVDKAAFKWLASKLINVVIAGEKFEMAEPQTTDFTDKLYRTLMTNKRIF